MLQRERELESVRAAIERVTDRIRDAQDAFDNAQRDVETGEEQEAVIDEALSDAAARTTDLKTELTRDETNLARLRERAETIEHEIGTLEAQSSGGESAAAAALANLESVRARLAEFAQQNDTLVAQRDMVRSELDDARAAWRDARETRHETQLKLESLRSRQQSLAHALARNEQQQRELRARCTDLETAMASTTAPESDLKTQLETALAARMEAEKQLGEARTELETIEGAIRSNDEARVGAERTVQERREALEEARLEGRAIEVRQQEVEQRVAQTDFSIEGLLEGMDDDADEPGWQDRLDRVRRRIDRLGPINLAAIDEFTQLSERKEYLDQQHTDLTEALETLEGAIRKIDRETRTRFKETFDKVNAKMKEMFPVLFGGGHAYLELTGDDLLETGVTVMARPPGKRNSTIHLLSGGEKALTALAFVFSLFELNPAPFCLLDEVDAPLDDANVVRLSKMLQSMSKTVQFICVTHNKITMEITEQLVGVTMQEAGVSRLVSVNMEEAVEMAAAS